MNCHKLILDMKIIGNVMLFFSFYYQLTCCSPSSCLLLHTIPVLEQVLFVSFAIIRPSIRAIKLLYLRVWESSNFVASSSPTDPLDESI